MLSGVNVAAFSARRLSGSGLRLTALQAIADFALRLDVIAFGFRKPKPRLVYNRCQLRQSADVADNIQCAIKVFDISETAAQGSRRNASGGT